MTEQTIQQTVRERYGEIAKGDGGCCDPTCCGGQEALEGSSRSVSEAIGYSRDELDSIPAGADLGLGSGNPVRAANLRPGETVLDLGSGAGVDCFLAANAVGPEGTVIGVDMTPEMIDRARRNKQEAGFMNVEFRLGEIEALPVADATVDVILSNCVVNLSSDRPRVLAEAFRVLKPGGRFVISDLVSEEGAPETLKHDAEAACACLPVAKDSYVADLIAAGFEAAEISQERAYPREELSTAPVAERLQESAPALAESVGRFVESVRGAIIAARKPL